MADSTEPEQSKEQVNNPHDRFARKTMGDPKIAADVLRHYADPVIAKHVDLESLKPEPTQNFGKEFRELVTDISFVSRLIDKDAKSEVLILAEHKSTPEPFVPLQLLTYLALSWYKRWANAGRPQSTKKFRLPIPVLVVIYNGSTEWQGDLSLENLVASAPAELRKLVPHIELLKIVLNRFDLSQLKGEPETQAVVESMIRATNGTFVAGLESVIGHFRETSLDNRIQQLIGDIIRYCNSTEGVSPEQVDKAIKNGIKGTGGIEMSQMIDGIWEVGHDHGLAKGIAVGMVQGEAKTIIRFLKVRFQSVSKSIEDKVYAITDVDRLDELTDKAATCQSLEEFAQSLG